MAIRLSSSAARKLGLKSSSPSRRSSKGRRRSLDPSMNMPSPSGPVRISIPLRAVPKERHRNAWTGHYTPERTREFSAAVKSLARPVMRGTAPFSGAIELRILFLFEVPRSWPAAKRRAALDGLIRPVSRPDLDNIGKGLMDALNGIVYKDDAQFVGKHVEEYYAEKDGIELRVQRSRSHEWLFPV